MGFEVNVPDDMFGDLIRNTSDDQLKAIVDSVAPTLVDSMKTSMSNVVKHEGESKMVNSIKATKAKATKTDAIMSFVRPTGTDNKRSDGSQRTKPIRNMEKAIYMNYGTVKEPARPWLEPAINKADAKIQNALQQEFEKRCLK